MADLTMYTMANPEILAAALEGIAMVFDPNNTDVWVSDPGTSNGFGLGAVAGIGMVISLFTILVRGVMTQKLEIWNFLIIIVIYTMAFVPKTTLQVERIQDGQIEVVDGIPYGVALPAALMSGMMKAITETFETAFQDPRVGSFNETGFMDPLKILGQMKGVATASAGGNGYLKQNMLKYIEICMVDAKSGTTLNVEAMVRKAGTLGNLFDETKIKSGIVPLYSKMGDDLALSYHSCNKQIGGNASGAETLRLQILEYIGSAAIVNGQFTGLEADLRLGGALKELSASNSARQAVKDSIATIAGMAAISTDVALQDLVVGSLMREAAKGLNIDDPTQVRMVMALTEGMERWRADSAGSGSMFLQTMQSSMDIMLFLWIAIAPILATVFIIMGMQGIQMLGKYFMFGVWTQSWMPFAMIINYYMQITLSDKVARSMMPGVSLADLFSPGNQVQLYDELANTVAASSQLLAFTPVLSLAILTGSYMALSSLGTAMSGKDGYFDEKKVAGDVDVATGAKGVHDKTTSMGMHGDAAMRSVQGAGDALIAHKAEGMGVTTTNSAAAVMEGVASQARQAASVASTGAYQTAFGSEQKHMQSATEAVKAAYTDEKGFNRTKLNEALKGLGVSNAAALEDSEATRIAAVAALKTKAGLELLGSGGGAEAGLQSDATTSSAFKEALQTVNDRKWNDKQASQFQEGIKASKGSEYANQAQSQASEALSKGARLEDTFQEQKALEENASKQAQSSTGAGSGLSIKNADLAIKLAEATAKGNLPMHELPQMLNQADMTDSARQKFDTAYQGAGGGWAGAAMGAHALTMSNDAREKASGMEMMGWLTDRAGGYGDHTGDGFRNTAASLRSMADLGQERFAQGEATKGAAATGLSGVEDAIGAGASQVAAANATVGANVSAGLSNERFEAAGANMEAQQAADARTRTGEGVGAVAQADTNMRENAANNRNSSLPALGLGIAQAGADVFHGGLNMLNGSLEAYGITGNGGHAADLQAAQEREQQQMGVLKAGEGLRNAQTTDQQLAAIEAYSAATGVVGEGPLDASTAEATRQQMLADFDGGRGAEAAAGASAARRDAAVAKGNLDISLNTIDYGGSQLDEPANLGRPGFNILQDQSSLPGRLDLEDHSQEEIDLVAPKNRQ